MHSSTPSLYFVAKTALPVTIGSLKYDIRYFLPTLFASQGPKSNTPSLGEIIAWNRCTYWEVKIGRDCASNAWFPFSSYFSFLVSFWVCQYQVLRSIMTISIKVGVWDPSRGSCFDRWFWSWKDQHPFSIHKERVQHRFEGNSRCGVCLQVYYHWWEGDKGTNLGYR